MSNLNPLNAYRETNIKTASQGKLVLMLYTEAVRQMETAVSALESAKPQIDQINNALIKAQDIITELMVSLDFDRGGEIAKNLYSLYIFFNRELMLANVKKDPEPVKSIIIMMKDLKDAWQQVFQKAGANVPQASTGINIAG